MAVSASRFRLIVSLSIFMVIFFTSKTSAVPAYVLYNDTMDLLILNSSNFYSTILNQDRAFTIEFYNSYCGHCQRYAEKWIAHGTDIKHWTSVVAPAVIDCSVQSNIQICRDYDIPAFPTIKNFWTHVTSSDHGLSVPPKNQKDDLRHGLIDFLTTNAQEKGNPTHWPMLLPMSAATLSDIWSNLPKEITAFFLVIEDSASYIGREVILDFSATNARVLRVEDTSANAVDNLPEISSYPALVLLRRNANPELLVSSSNVRTAREEFRNAIQDATGITLDTSSEGSEENPDKNKDESAKNNQTLPVQMVDLENALHNILVQEVALKQELSGDKLTAFKSFLAALTKTFPGRAPVMNFLQNLYNWVLQQGTVINMDDLQRNIQERQSSNAFLPDMSDWVGCKGSVPRYRGYTCSLWTLFHSMTVKAYQNYLAGETTHPQQVLHAIHNYVYNFFGCTECAQHFHGMAVTLESETQYPNDTILWLWRAHNRVNQRLKGDATEDPAYPKIQFPPVSLCNQCRKNSEPNTVDWDVPVVLRFLMSYYGSDHISQEGIVPYRAPTPVVRRRRTETNKFPSFGWNFRYFSGLDISLCVLLYAFSMVLLIVVFLVFRFRRHKLKRKHFYSSKQLP